MKDKFNHILNIGDHVLADYYGSDGHHLIVGKIKSFRYNSNYVYVFEINLKFGYWWNCSTLEKIPDNYTQTYIEERIMLFNLEQK